MNHDLLVYLAKTFAPIWMMAFFIIVVIRTYSPRRRRDYERVARSILTDRGPEVSDER